MARRMAGVAAVIALLLLGGCTESGDAPSNGSSQPVESAEPSGASIRDGDFAITVEAEGVRHGVAADGQFVKTLDDGLVAAYIDAGQSYAGVPLRVQNLGLRPGGYAFSVMATGIDGEDYSPRLIVGGQYVFGGWHTGDSELSPGIPPGDSVTVEAIFKLPDGGQLVSITIQGTEEGFTAEIPL